MEVINKFISKNYRISHKFEAGLVLTGPEVKACKLKQVNFKGAYCNFGDRGFFYLKNFYIAPYMPACREQKKYDANQARRVLLTAKEVRLISQNLRQKGTTVIPSRIYTKNNLVKMEIVLATGIRRADLRQKIKNDEIAKNIKRIIKQ